jgi:hypothetical protein
MKSFKVFTENAKEAKNKITSLGVYKAVRKKGGIDPKTGKYTYGGRELKDPLTGMSPKDFDDNQKRWNKNDKKDDK